ncbi:MAG: hypothetical protein LBD07_01555 [Spirochaetaceae bacterium]|jgi:magnesium-transporting ATPase (P-type)|nr:hypothetical protein [Spirochaetaceae bacterium]
MDVSKVFLKIINISLHCLCILFLSLFSVIAVASLKFDTQKYILENILNGGPVVDGYEVFYLYYLIFITSFIVYSIPAFIIVNIKPKKYSNRKMLLTTAAFIIILSMLYLMFNDFYLLFLLISLPLLQRLFSRKNQQNTEKRSAFT